MVGAGLAEGRFVVVASGDGEHAGAGGVSGGHVAGRVADDEGAGSGSLNTTCLRQRLDGSSHNLRAVGGDISEAASHEAVPDAVVAQLQLGALRNVSRGQPDDGLGALQRVEEVDDTVEDTPVVGAEGFREALDVGGRHAVDCVGSGVDAHEPECVGEDAGVGAAVDLDAVEAREAGFGRERVGDGVAAGAAAVDEGAVDVEEEEAHLGQCSPRSRQGQVAARRVLWQSWGMTAVPELRTLAERAAGRRHMLEGLIESVPDDYWERQASGDDWTALDHLRHVATVDGMLVNLLEAAQEPGRDLWAGDTSDEAELEARRVALMDGVREQTVEALVETMRESREAAMEAVLAMPAAALEREVRVAGAPQGFPLRTYLAVWAEHDSEHEAAIRRAMETPPDATTLTLAARRARGSR